MAFELYRSNQRLVFKPDNLNTEREALLFMPLNKRMVFQRDAAPP